MPNSVFIVVMVDGRELLSVHAVSKTCAQESERCRVTRSYRLDKNLQPKKYPYMDIDRVGIYGCSAGGQESMTAVLFHPDFYKAAYSACGCHDNRMDKNLVE